ncbi:hypothetical protein DACRYDRAFT_107879 [Dacryopinax primogenitus]|uniref:RNI-like protein n=1 Tax=Dacryopinax primogenitus (strain DJM 731) TaxID=1858805 RepID=M5FXU2_DACPD|nr:uncharacterized protein DACRYDRAFT_107879 [Dacryopinax primogenitus]EJU01324.1 hypothetical protein DACRYDRAFT_107879 [Dacryopinax primogenitus]
MHAVFRLPELFEVVCAHGTPSTLAALARTSSALFLPAVSELYRNAGYQQLFHMVWVYLQRQQKQHVEGWDTMQHDTMPAWRRFQIYAPLIWHLSIVGDMWNALLKGTHGGNVAYTPEKLLLYLSSIASVSDLHPVFPNLRSLKIDPVKTQPLGSLIILLSGNLTSLVTVHLNLASAIAKPDVAAMLDILPDRAPVLKCLELVGAVSDAQELSLSITRMIQAFPQLEELSCGTACLQAGILLGLSKLSNLRSIRIIGTLLVPTRIPTKMPGSRHLHEPLPSLRVIHIEEVASSMAGPLLSQLGTPSVEAVTVNLSSNESSPFPDEIKALFLAVSRFTSLRDFSISARGQGPRGHSAAFWQYGSILFTCSRLQKCVLRNWLFPASPVDDELIESMAMAWPDLQALSLQWNVGKNDVLSTPTLNSLAVLFNHCPRLTHLQLWSLSAPVGRTPVVDSCLQPRPLWLGVRHNNIEDVDDASIFFVTLTSALEVYMESSPEAFAWWDDFDTTPWNNIILRMRTLRRYIQMQADKKGTAFDNRMDNFTLESGHNCPPAPVFI